MDGNFSYNKFDYVWRNISLNLLLVDKNFDNTVGVENSGHFKPEEEVKEVLVKTVKDDDDDDNNDDEDDNDDKSKDDDEQNPYFDDKEPGPEE